MTTTLLSLLSIAFVVSGLLCRLSLWVHRHFAVIDQPGREDHKKHSQSVPYGGGPAMMLALVLLVTASLLTQLPMTSSLSDHGFIPVGCGALALAALGWWDDRKPLGAILKLCIQLIIMGTCVIWGNLAIDLIAGMPLLGFGIAILWCVLITNAYNLLDHADGMSSVIAIISLVVLVSASLMNDDISLASFHIMLIGVLGGFLLWNLPPARMYMGDSGSLPLGFLVATGCLQVTFWDSGNPESSGRIALLAPLLVSAIPIYDVLVVVTKRLRHQTPIMKGDRNHISHRLSRLGLSPLATLGAVAALQTTIAGSALLLRSAAPTTAIIVVLQAASVILAAILLEARRDHYQ